MTSLAQATWLSEHGICCFRVSEDQTRWSACWISSWGRHLNYGWTYGCCQDHWKRFRSFRNWGLDLICWFSQLYNKCVIFLSELDLLIGIIFVIELCYIVVASLFLWNILWFWYVLSLSCIRKGIFAPNDVCGLQWCVLVPYLIGEVAYHVLALIGFVDSRKDGDPLAFYWP